MQGSPSRLCRTSWPSDCATPGPRCWRWSGTRTAAATPKRGRFRTFLLTSLRNFLANEWQRGQAAKRGGGQGPVPLEVSTAGGRIAREPADPDLPPEQAFDRNYALD